MQYWHWLVEWDTPTLGHIKAIKGVIYSGKSKYQNIMVVETYEYGRALILDGKTQSTEADEFIYHEALVHPAMILHGAPRKILILGGGEGATLREALKYKSVEKAVMVDIDEEVIRVSREYMGFMSGGAFEDKRVNLVIGDALDYVFNTNEAFDVIIADLSDPIAEGPSYKLYTREFYIKVSDILSPNGVFVTQATSPTNTPETHAVIYSTIKSVFAKTAYYHIFIPAFEALWGFIIASKTLDPRGLSPKDVDEALTRHGIRTRFYDSTAHIHMFSVPRNLREFIDKETRIATFDNPVYMPA